MSAPKKSKSVETCGGGSSFSPTIGGGGVTETCIMHFSDVKTSDTITLLSKSENPSERLQKINDICRRRLLEPQGSVHRMTDICSQVPSTYSEERMYGYHRQCYQRFTGNLNRLQASAVLEEKPSTSRPKRRSSIEKYIFPPECIFCGKEGKRRVKKGSIWTTESLSKFEYGGGATILETAENSCDYSMLRKIKGYDLFACEAQYHSLCRREYTRKPTNLSMDIHSKSQQSNMEAAHKNAFTEVCAVVDNKLIKEGGIIKLSDLLETYVTRLETTPYANPKYRSDNLKAKLVKCYDENLSFVQLGSQGKYQSSLVYKSSIDISSLVRLTYELSSADRISKMALQLYESIIDKFKTTEAYRWPPTARDLEDQDGILPPDLQKFITILITGQESASNSMKVTRLVSSLGQDLCRSATNGLWKLPKHILLCMTLRHMFRSAELITLISRLGHSENYSYSLELETALATMVQQSSNMLTSQIIRNPVGNTVFHSDFDNFDKFTATGSVHTAHGIMLQEVDQIGEEAVELDIPTIERTKQRSLDVVFDSREMSECYVTQRKSPLYAVSIWTCPTGNVAAKNKASVYKSLSLRAAASHFGLRNSICKFS